MADAGQLSTPGVPESELDMLLQRLRKNRECIPIDKLKTTYASSYSALLRDISAAARKWAMLYVGEFSPPEGDWVEELDPDELEAKDPLYPEYANQRRLILDKSLTDGEIASGIRELIGDLDRDRFERSVIYTVEKVYNAYVPYFYSRLSVIEPGYVYSDILDAIWIESAQRWYGKRGFLGPFWFDDPRVDSFEKFPLPAPPQPMIEKARYMNGEG